ncbi:hypothetical protein [Pseudoxanthomonas dokdonensis]|uniref:Uncharacterized protein n=1 Tax=Pseudoxanthomonas dokdonensis TaxID=344882 RepID=A0A0R0CSG5_9GAMM|nr:hypothetical protein [Pseudoxanthomonas dokdonensis]KRG69015.1 hypothetical protein ABB29_11280 [Pseudoxanthomonas dokdonensis]
MLSPALQDSTLPEPLPAMRSRWREHAIHIGAVADVEALDELARRVSAACAHDGHSAHLVVIADAQACQRPAHSAIDWTDWSIGGRWLRYQHQAGRLFEPGHHEVFGNVVLFALATGVPLSALNLRACDPQRPLPAAWTSHARPQVYLHLRH